jgi:hypothetical protein
MADASVAAGDRLDVLFTLMRSEWDGNEYIIVARDLRQPGKLLTAGAAFARRNLLQGAN